MVECDFSFKAGSAMKIQVVAGYIITCRVETNMHAPQRAKSFSMHSKYLCDSVNSDNPLITCYQSLAWWLLQ